MVSWVFDADSVVAEAIERYRLHFGLAAGIPVEAYAGATHEVDGEPVIMAERAINVPQFHLMEVFMNQRGRVLILGEPPPLISFFLSFFLSFSSGEKAKKEGFLFFHFRL